MECKNFLRLYQVGCYDSPGPIIEFILTPLLDLKKEDYLTLYVSVPNIFDFGTRRCKILTRSMFNQLLDSPSSYVKYGSSIANLLGTNKESNNIVEVFQIDLDDFIPFLSTWLVINENGLGDAAFAGFIDYIELMKKYYGE